MNAIKSILLFSLLTLFACNNDKKEENTSQTSGVKAEKGTISLTKAQFESANMEWGSLEEKPFAQSVHTNGEIDVPPQSRAIVSAFAGGYIKNAPLLVGDKVSKGQQLVTLENPEFITLQQNYLETAEQLIYLKTEYERQKTMFDENITSQKSFLKSESAYKTALARSNSLKKNLKMLNINPASAEAGNIVSQVSISSPIDGNVTGVFVNTGTYVSPADKIMEIMNTDHIHLELKAFEKDLLQLKKGQEISFTIPEASKEQFKGEVHLVGTSINSKSRIAMVHGHIDEKEEQNFTAGMFVEAKIVTGSSNQMALPESAVVELNDRHYVLLLESRDADRYKLRSLEVKVKMNYQGFVTFEDDEKLISDAHFLTKGGFVLLQD